jgi:hypothetical protein
LIILVGKVVLVRAFGVFTAISVDVGAVLFGTILIFSIYQYGHVQKLLDCTVSH